MLLEGRLSFFKCFCGLVVLYFGEVGGFVFILDMRKWEIEVWRDEVICVKVFGW